MKLAVMQPYIFPHLAYFQLIDKVDTFIFYDDVNFIKKGWIHRNYITINKKLQRFSIPLKHSSQNKKINEIEINWNSKEMKKLIKTFDQNIKNSVSRTVLNKIINLQPKTISEMAIASIQECSICLGIKTNFKKSSEINFKRHDQNVLNLIEFCKHENSNEYYNSIGGQQLYDKKDFSKHDIDLKFINGTITPSILEIIDNKNIKQQLKNYECI